MISNNFPQPNDNSAQSNDEQREEGGVLGWFSDSKTQCLSVKSVICEKRYLSKALSVKSFICQSIICHMYYLSKMLSVKKAASVNFSKVLSVKSVICLKRYLSKVLSVKSVFCQKRYLSKAVSV